MTLVLGLIVHTTNASLSLYGARWNTYFRNIRGGSKIAESEVILLRLVMILNELKLQTLLFIFPRS